MSLRAFFEQIRQTAAGTSSLMRHTHCAEAVETSLSSFRARSPVVERGVAAVYHLACIHDGPQPLWATLVLDVHAENAMLPAGRYASFRKEILLPSRENLVLEIHYDWVETVSLGFDDIWVAPDVFERGASGTPGHYRIRASLSRRTGALIESLTLRQRLMA
jgi:hypothetical protein